MLIFEMLDMPDEPRDRARWIEDRVVSHSLGDLIATIEGFQRLSDDDAADPSDVPVATAFEDWIAQNGNAIRNDGLAMLPEAAIDELTTRPQMLGELQVWTASQVDGYWNDRWNESSTQFDPEPVIGRFRRHLTDAQHRPISDASGSVVSSPTSNATLPVGSVNRNDAEAEPVSRRRDWSIALAVAATLLLGLGVWSTFGRDAPVDWGFGRVGVLTAERPPADYLESLAEAVQEWFDERPEDAEALRTRLIELSEGCQRVLDAPHEQLADNDRDWLIRHCRRWKLRVDELRTDLAAGNVGFADGVESAEEIVDRLTAGLDARAASLRG